jgi:transcriptional regulator with XRE-family HTH domain
MIFGQRLKHLRKLHQLTQEDMAEKLNMEQSTYSRYEKDKTKSVSHIIVLKVAKEFNVSADWLLGNNNNPPLSY